MCAVMRAGTCAPVDGARRVDRDDQNTANTIDDSARARTNVVRAATTSTSEPPVLYARVSSSGSLERDVKTLRCYAAIAREASRALVLVEDATSAEATKPLTDLVAPVDAAWRRWGEGDDERIKSGDARWCAHVREAVPRGAAQEVSRRFKRARDACLTFDVAHAKCGRNVHMVLSTNVEADIANSIDVEALVKAGLVSKDVVVKPLESEVGANASGANIVSSSVVRNGDNEEDVATVGLVEDERMRREQEVFIGEEESEEMDIEESARVPETKVLQSVVRRQSNATRNIDTSRALVYFGAAVGLVGFFINSFASARQASKRDELAKLVLHPDSLTYSSPSFSIASSPAKKETASAHDNP